MIAIENVRLGRGRSRTAPLSAQLEPGLTLVVGDATLVEALLTHVAGLPPARSGRVVIAGTDVRGPRADVLYLGRTVSLVGTTPREHLAHVSAWRATDASVAPAHALPSELLDRSVDACTAREKRRVRLAEVSAVVPRVTIAIAPLAELDAQDVVGAARAFVPRENQARAVLLGGLVRCDAFAFADAAAADPSSAPVRVATVTRDEIVVAPMKRGLHPHAVRVLTSDAVRLAAALGEREGVARVDARESMVVLWGDDRGALLRALAEAVAASGALVGAIS